MPKTWFVNTPPKNTKKRKKHHSLQISHNACFFNLFLTTKHKKTQDIKHHNTQNHQGSQ
jgi:hypothetical protein